MPGFEEKPTLASGGSSPNEGSGTRELQSYWEVLADKLERRPEMLKVARQNLGRWRAAGHSAPHRLEQWEALIMDAERDARGFRRVIDILRSPDPSSERLREFSPFAGILTREERRRTRELCGYRH